MQTVQVRCVHSLERLGHTVRLDVRVPVLLPAVTLPTHLALEGLQAHVLVHMLLEIFGFVEPLVTAAGDEAQRVNSASSSRCVSLPCNKVMEGQQLLTENRRMDARQVWAGASSGVCSERRLDGKLLHMCCTGTLIHLPKYFTVLSLTCPE